MDRVRDGAHSVSHSVADKATHIGSDAFKKITDEVEERPLTMLAIATVWFSFWPVTALESLGHAPQPRHRIRHESPFQQAKTPHDRSVSACAVHARRCLLFHNGGDAGPGGRIWLAARASDRGCDLYRRGVDRAYRALGDAKEAAD